MTKTAVEKIDRYPLPITVKISINNQFFCL